MPMVKLTPKLVKRIQTDMRTFGLKSGCIMYRGEPFFYRMRVKTTKHGYIKTHAIDVWRVNDIEHQIPLYQIGTFTADEEEY